VVLWSVKTELGKHGSLWRVCSRNGTLVGGHGGAPYGNFENGAVLRKAFTSPLMIWTFDTESLHQGLEGGSFEA
jgi:hypothetical protein